jgi:hypothetical protein
MRELEWPITQKYQSVLTSLSYRDRESEEELRAQVLYIQNLRKF